MYQKSSYTNYYESGSAARKREAVRTEVTPSKKEERVIKAKPNIKLMLFILCIFGMTMFLTYRFNLINEKNLKSQNLKKELTSLEGNVLTSKIEVDQNTDLIKIESYAKQQLGMQKPGKNQTIYIDTSKSVENTVENTEESSTISKIIDTVKSFFNSIF